MWIFWFLRGRHTLIYDLKLPCRPTTDTIEQVKRFNYLGNQINYQNYCDIHNKLNKFQYMCDTVHKNLRNKVRRETVAILTLFYGSQNWVLTKRQRGRLQASEVDFLRAMKDCTRLSRFSNLDIRTELNLDQILSPESTIIE